MRSGCTRIDHLDNLDRLLPCFPGGSNDRPSVQHIDDVLIDLVWLDIDP
jgi:hypothetical protein